MESPQHTLPPNTICRYQFVGRRHETVWLSFIKYHSTLDPAVFEPPSECSAQLRIWDGKWNLPVTSTTTSNNSATAKPTDDLSSHGKIIIFHLLLNIKIIFLPYTYFFHTDNTTLSSIFTSYNIIQHSVLLSRLIVDH